MNTSREPGAKADLLRAISALSKGVAKDGQMSWSVWKGGGEMWAKGRKEL